MPEPGFGGSSAGSGMGAGTKADIGELELDKIGDIGYDLGAILDKIANPGSTDWGLGPEGSGGTSTRRAGEDRDFGDDVSLQQKTAFMQKNVPASVSSSPVSSSSAITALKSNLAKKGYKTKSTALQNKQAFMDKNPFGHPNSFEMLSAVTRSPDQPTNSPMSWSDIAKTDMESKKHSAASMPSDWMARNIFNDESNQTADIYDNIRALKGELSALRSRAPLIESSYSNPRVGVSQNYANVSPHIGMLIDMVNNQAPLYEGGSRPPVDYSIVTDDPTRPVIDPAQKNNFQKIGFLNKMGGLLRDAYYRSSLPKTYSPMSENLKNPQFYGWMLEALGDMKRQRALSRLFGSDETEYDGPPININLDKLDNRYPDI